MPSTGFVSTYPLTCAGITQNVGLVMPGVYALGDIDQNGAFYVRLVGRSDNDVGGRLRDYLGKYQAFMFSYYRSAREAYEKECELYHAFDPNDNDFHPDSPANALRICPWCR